MRKLTRALIAGAVGTGIVLAGTPAYATAATCHLGRWDTSCTSGIVWNNPAGHWVDYHIDFYSGNYAVSWQIVDVDTGATVRSGRQIGGSTSGTVTGLYGRYRLKMQKGLLNGGADGVLENELP